jgi:hypothetical protein
MSDGGKRNDAEGKTGGQSRRVRQAEALRANLHKRKARQRSRRETEAPASETAKKTDCNPS